ncbi:hypothetical protein FPV67DRAFT_1453586 [Lyophyllum atratum]|nr:hypothetical protein FPV67DRAFT_1677854 [Lyophyllum atratum]KAF8059897.1 hypothetical protein FPV67DRAFT_1453586 [Lyophyllum atratum]
MPRTVELPPGILVNVLNDKQCRAWVDRWCNIRETSPEHGAFQLCKYDTLDKVRQEFQVQSKPGGYMFLEWRGTGEEVVLDVSGIIGATVLPPITKYAKFNPANRRDIMMSVSLVAFENPQFQRALKALAMIHQYFDEHLQEGQLRPLNAHTVGGVDALYAGTRFITPLEQNVFSTADIPDGYDPDRVLHDILGAGEYVFTDDNIVEFLEVVPDTHGGGKKASTPPASFRKGHIAEISMCFRAVKVGRSYVPLSRLDSVLRLSRIGSELIRAHQDALRSQSRVATTIIAPKRRRGLDEVVPIVAKRTRESGEGDEITHERNKEVTVAECNLSMTTLHSALPSDMDTQLG